MNKSLLRQDRACFQVVRSQVKQAQFKPAKMASTKAKPDVRIQLQFQEVAKSSESRPSLPRSGACASPLPAWHTHDAVMFGGYTEDISKASNPPTMRNATDDMYVFSKAEGKWEQLKHGHKGMPSPQARLSSQLVLAGDHLYLIAGWDPAVFGSGGDVLSDMWRYNLRTNTWGQLDLQGECLGAIARFQAAAIGPLIYIHSHRSLLDIHVLDTSAEPPVLHKLIVNGNDAVAPGPASRGLHSLVPVGGKLLLFGGAPKEGPMMDDLWSLDLTTLKWTRVNPTGFSPAARCSHFAGCIDDRYMWLVGGAYYESPGKLANVDDVAVYDSYTNAWLEVDVTGPRPSARNAGVSVCLSSADKAEVVAAGCNQVLLHAGWRAFAETYNDTFLLSLKVTSK